MVGPTPIGVPHPQEEQSFESHGRCRSIDRGRGCVNVHRPGTQDASATVCRRSLRLWDPDELERRLRERLDGLPRLPSPNSSTSWCSPTSSAPSGSAIWSYPQRRNSAELLIDCEEDRTLRAVLVGMQQDCALELQGPVAAPATTGPRLFPIP